MSTSAEFSRELLSGAVSLPIPRWHVQHSGILFWTEDITFAPSFYTPVIVLLFFILVNMIGAFLGYLLGKNIEPESPSDRWKALWGIVGISLIILGFTLFPMLLTERFLLSIIGTGTLMLEILLPDKLVEFWKNPDSGPVSTFVWIMFLAVIAIAACLFLLLILIYMFS